MATKRKISCDGEISMEKKRARMEDRLTNLPNDLKLRILSFLDTKYTVQTLTLSKRWVSLWTWIPIMEFNYFPNFSKLHDFDKFVGRVLCLRDRSAKLERLTFTRGDGICSAKLLKSVFDYAFSHSVKQLEACIVNSRNHTWPVCLHVSFESLTSLKLQSEISISCPFLGPRSGSFKNLSVLYLKRAIITDPDPFSGFPVLEKLTLVNCDVNTEGETKTLNVHALNLSELTICSRYQNFDSCELTTPRLGFFEHRGCEYPLVRRHKGLPALDTIVIGFYGGCRHSHEKRMFDNLLSLFSTLDNAKSLKIFWSTVEILSSFPEELVKRSSPFGNLKCLKLDFRSGFLGPFESCKILSDVKAFLLQKSPDARIFGFL